MKDFTETQKLVDWCSRHYGFYFHRFRENLIHLFPNPDTMAEENKKSIEEWESVSIEKTRKEFFDVVGNDLDHLQLYFDAWCRKLDQAPYFEHNVYYLQKRWEKFLEEDVPPTYKDRIDVLECCYDIICKVGFILFELDYMVEDIAYTYNLDWSNYSPKNYESELRVFEWDDAYLEYYKGTPDPPKFGEISEVDDEAIMKLCKCRETAVARWKPKRLKADDRWNPQSLDDKPQREQIDKQLTLPKALDTTEFRLILQEAIKKSLIEQKDTGYAWKGSVALLSHFAYKCSSKLNLAEGVTAWKLFEELFGKRQLASSYNRASGKLKKELSWIDALI